MKQNIINLVMLVCAIVSGMVLEYCWLRINGYFKEEKLKDKR